MTGKKTFWTFFFWPAVCWCTMASGGAGHVCEPNRSIGHFPRYKRPVLLELSCRAFDLEWHTITCAEGLRPSALPCTHVTGIRARERERGNDLFDISPPFYSRVCLARVRNVLRSSPFRSFQRIFLSPPLFFSFFPVCVNAELHTFATIQQPTESTSPVQTFTLKE